MEMRRVAATLALSCSALILTSCVARRRAIARNKTATTQTLLTADKQALLKVIETEYQSVSTLNATVDMVPAVGSVNKGKITEYKDFRAYIFFKKPGDFRIIGLYPVVRNKAFDMVSHGTNFRLFLPSKNQFIIGRNEPSDTPSPNKLENLRPSVFLDALLIQPPDPQQFSVLADFTDEDNAAYILHVFYNGPDGQPHIARDIWFDRLNLHMVRQMIFDPAGEILTDARYTDWTVYDRVPFPKVIDINRPKDEYGVVITVVKADVNKPITSERFELEQPEGTVLQVLGSKSTQTHVPAPAADSSASRKKKDSK
jgi:hypothetical protein